MKEEKEYIYNDISERMKLMNKLYLKETALLGVVFLLYLWLKSWKGGLSIVFTIVNTVLLLIFTVINLVVYNKNQADKKLRGIATVEMCIEYFLIGIETDARFISFVLVAVLLLQIPYYDKKALKRNRNGVMLIFILVTIVQSVKKIVPTNVDTLCSMVIVLAIFYMATKVGSIAVAFYQDALGSVDAQQQKQKEILDGLVEISKTVQEESVKSSDLIDKLVDVSESVAGSMKEISAASNTTACSIEEQSNMTSSIQDAIGLTSESSKKMVEIATSSSERIQENMRVMEELKVQSAQISETNSEVTEAMTKLQNKTKEVENIAGMILNISNQTNLLALNASIESARAGEAGRGFAVVAEQIRQLAEQTRNSTEEITNIINELNENADEVVASVEGSVTAAESQNEKILAASDTYELLKHNIEELVAHIDEVNTQISGLSESNNKIVENISQLSASTEEITASAEQVHEKTEQNLMNAENVKEAVNLIRSTTDDMKKYL